MLSLLQVCTRWRCWLTWMKCAQPRLETSARCTGAVVFSSWYVRHHSLYVCLWISRFHNVYDLASLLCALMCRWWVPVCFLEWPHPTLYLWETIPPSWSLMTAWISYCSMLSITSCSTLICTSRTTLWIIKLPTRNAEFNTLICCLFLNFSYLFFF